MGEQELDESVVRDERVRRPLIRWRQPTRDYVAAAAITAGRWPPPVWQGWALLAVDGSRPRGGGGFSVGLHRDRAAGRVGAGGDRAPTATVGPRDEPWCVESRHVGAAGPGPRRTAGDVARDPAGRVASAAGRGVAGGDSGVEHDPGRDLPLRRCETPRDRCPERRRTGRPPGGRAAGRPGAIVGSLWTVVASLGYALAVVVVRAPRAGALVTATPTPAPDP